MEPYTNTPGGLVVERKGETAHITLDRPDRRNALSAPLLADLEVVLTQIAGEQQIRAVVLGASGPFFCHDLDLRETDGSEGAYSHLLALASRVMLQLRQLPQPVLARVQGVTTGAGCQLVAACDLAVAAEGATFAIPPGTFGAGESAALAPLLRLLPPRAVLEMLLTGNPIGARRALELGLVNRVVAAGALDAALREYIDAMLASGGQTLRRGKAAFYDQLALEEAIALHRAADVKERPLTAEEQQAIRAAPPPRVPRRPGE
jgi:enoyl-CoA hydratase/carnithine racemase